MAAEREIDLRRAESRILEDPVVQLVSGEASKRGLKVYLVGGAVRDHILGRPHKDYDFVLDKFCASFLKALGAFFKTTYFPMGKGERVYRLVKDEKILDFSLLSGNDITEDLRRRDFTINAIAYCPRERKFFCHPRSLEDLRKGRIVLLSPRALLDDPLRILRAFRYMATLGFEMDGDLYREIERKGELLLTVAGERILMELDEIFLSPDPSRALWTMARSGILEVLFPEMSPLKGLQQGTHHRRDAFSHCIAVTVLALRMAKAKDPLPFPEDHQDLLVLAYSCLFHDLGKPETLTIDESGNIHFYGHQTVSRKKAQHIMARYPFPNQLKQRVLRVIENHMRPLSLIKGNPSERALRRLVHDLGRDINPLLILALAEAQDKGKEEDWRLYLELSLKVLQLMEREELVKPPPLLSGRDLLQMGFRPGPRIGEILKAVRELQVDGEIRTREEALEFVRRNYQPE